MSMAKLVKLIYTTETRGKGTEESPFRMVEQWYELDGTFVVERDPTPDASWITSTKTVERP